MSYIEQYINESQIQYPNASQHPLEVILHAFFVLGNGIRYVEGNPVINAGPFYRNVYFKDYYREDLDYKKMLEIYEERQLQPRLLDENVGEKEREMIKKSYDEAKRTQVTLEDFNFENLLDPKKVRDAIYTLSHSPVIMSLNSGNHDFDNFTEKTCPLLLRLAISVGKGAVMFMKEWLEGEGEFPPPEGDADRMEWMYQNAVSSIEDHIIKWESLLVKGQ